MTILKRLNDKIFPTTHTHERITFTSFCYPFALFFTLFVHWDEWTSKRENVNDRCRKYYTMLRPTTTNVLQNRRDNQREKKSRPPQKTWHSEWEMERASGLVTGLIEIGFMVCKNGNMCQVLNNTTSKYT